MMKISAHTILKQATALMFACCCMDAGAWFFVFIPGSVIDKLGDALTGAEGDNCVANAAKVGDVLTSPTGNTATIKSISGPSSKCQNPNFPVRAALDFTYSFTSKAGIDLSETFQARELTALQRFNGTLMHVNDPDRSIGLVISATPKVSGKDGAKIARAAAENIIRLVEDGKASDAEELSINGLHAHRFQVVGKNKGIFGQSYTYLVTVLEGKREFVVINANCLTSDFAERRPELLRFAFDVRGLEEEQTAKSSSDKTGDVSARSQLPKETISGADGPPSELPNGPSQMGGSPKQTGASIVERLRTLDKLLKEGLISPADYEEKKQVLLREL